MVDSERALVWRASEASAARMFFQNRPFPPPVARYTIIVKKKTLASPQPRRRNKREKNVLNFFTNTIERILNKYHWTIDFIPSLHNSFSNSKLMLVANQSWHTPCFWRRKERKFLETNFGPNIASKLLKRTVPPILYRK